MMRQFFSRTISQTLSLIINLYNININMGEYTALKGMSNLSEHLKGLGEESQEYIRYQVTDILCNYLEKMTSEVPKNWSRFGEYFSFWNSLVVSCKGIHEFMFEHSFIARFIDFYLELKSPVKVFPKPVTLQGNKYSMPYGELFRVLATLVKMSRPEQLRPEQADGTGLHALSEYDKTCLYCVDLWSSCINDNQGIEHMVQIAQHLCYNELVLSEKICTAILRGFYRITYMESKPVIKLLRGLISIQDKYTCQRLDWLLGVPVLLQKQYANQTHFGTFQIQSLSDEIYFFKSPLQFESSGCLLQSIIYNQKSSESMCMRFIKNLLHAVNQSDVLAEYFARVPSPYILRAKYIDWIKQFVQDVIESNSKFYLMTRSQSGAQKALVEINKYQAKCEEMMRLFGEKHHAQLYQLEPNALYAVPGPSVQRAFFRPYLIGQTVAKTVAR